MNVCRNCSGELTGRSPNARSCDEACRGAYRRGKPPAVPVVDGVDGPLVLAVNAYAVDVQLDGTPLQQMGVALARQVDSGQTPPGALAGIVRQLMAVMVEFESQGKVAPTSKLAQLRQRRDWLDELRDRSQSSVSERRAGT